MAWANEKADELAKPGANQFGAEVSQRIVKGALDIRTTGCAAIQYAATFHDGVEELVYVEEVSQRDKHEPEC